MTFQDNDEVIAIVKDLQKTPDWVEKARKTNEKYKALVYGDKFDELLLQKIEKIESTARQEARRKYSKDIRDMFSRIFEPRLNIFSSSGGIITKEIRTEEQKEQLYDILTNFKGNLSIDKYLSEYFFNLLDVDPNGLIFMEYDGGNKIYPAYKSIEDIQHYETDGQNVNVLVFKPVPYYINGAKSHRKKWRVVDDKKDYCVIQDGGNFVVDEDQTFEHPFGQVPGVVLSNTQKLGTEIRLSPVFPIESIAENVARDASVLTLYKFLQGFPMHWRYIQQCRACKGTGKTGENTCKHCNGKGTLGKNDVTDVLEIDLPRDKDDANVAPNLAGFIQPDIKTWEQLKTDIKDQEEKASNTIWGTAKVKEGGNETATGRFIDVQPVMNKLNIFADNVEWVHNELVKFVLRWQDNNPETNNTYHKTYGRGFIIESPDELLKRYHEGRKDGSNFVVLDRLLKEYLTSKYKNNHKVLENNLKKIIVEPYTHLSIQQVSDVFGFREAFIKSSFEDFWYQADMNKTAEQLKEDFEAYKSTLEIPEQQANNQINNNNG